MNSTISIITVVYNDVKNIEKSIRNTLCQTYPQIELIVVDGDSTDGTVEIVKKYSDKIKWISEPDKGLYDAMNKGTHMASGDWVIFHNCGDFFLSRDSIKRVFDEYKEDKGEQFILAQTRDVESYGFIDREPGILSKSYYDAMPVCPPATFVRRTWMLKYPYDIQYRNSADYDFFVRSLKNGATFFYVNQPLVLFDCTEGTTAEHYDVTIKENIVHLTVSGASEKSISKWEKLLKRYKRNKWLYCHIPIMKLIIDWHRKQNYKKEGWVLANPDELLRKVDV